MRGNVLLNCDTQLRLKPCSFLGPPPSHSPKGLARVQAATHDLPKQDTIRAQPLLYQFYAPGVALVQPATDTLETYTFANT